MQGVYYYQREISMLQFKVWRILSDDISSAYFIFPLILYDITIKQILGRRIDSQNIILFFFILCKLKVYKSLSKSVFWVNTISLNLFYVQNLFYV